MTEIILHTTHCSKCNVLRTKLETAGINFTINEDPAIMVELGFREAPVLQVGDKFMPFMEAIKWVVSMERGAE